MVAWPQAKQGCPVMMIIRPVTADDANALMELAIAAGVGFTSLPPDEARISKRIQASLEAFAKKLNKPENESYLFVMEDSETGTVAGCCGLESAVGMDEPWYNYRIGTLVHASREMEVHNVFPTLYLSNDHTGCAEVCTLFLRPEYRKDKNGALLSKSRFMFLAEFPHRFAEKIIAEMRGYSDDQGRSPFWEGLGRHFFSMDFAEADRLCGLGNKSFIAELMPRHSLYINLLPPEAQSVIGKVHDNTVPARRMLESEGFRYEGYVDIFDAGPTLETRVADIRAVRESRYFRVRIGQPEAGELHLVSNTELNDYRCTQLALSINDHNQVVLPAEAAAALKVEDGDTVRVVPLSSGRRF